ncbi:MAG: VCBS domain-containing protein [Pseudomonadota bacterium]
MAKVGPDATGTATADVLISGAADRVVVPNAEALFQGDYDRDGPDLVISGPDGTVLRIVDYFSSDTPPALFSEAGATVTPDLVARLAGPQAGPVYAQAGPPAGAQPIGQVETLEGSAFATRANGQRVSLQVGDPVFEDDLVETGDGSNLGITFVDETVFSLSPNARMVLDELVYEAGGSNNSMVMNLVQGTFVFVTGQVAPSGEMVVETPVATMGIRGTTPIVIIQGQNGDTEFGILRNPNGGVGAYEIRDKNTGETIGRVVEESTVFQLDQVGGALAPVTIDAARLAERAEAQSNAYFVYTVARSRIGSQTQDNNQNGDDQNQDGADPITTESIGPPGSGSGGLDGFDIEIDELGEGESDAETDDGTEESGDQSDAGGPSGSQFETNIEPTAQDQAFQLGEDVEIALGSFEASDPDGPGEIRFEIVQQPEFGAVVVNGDGTFSFILDPIFQTLAVGEVTSVSFVYRALDDFDAASDPATVTLQIIGANDVPVITVVDVEGAVTDISEAPQDPPPVNAGDQTATGSITFFDIDGSDRPTATEETFSVTALTQEGEPRELTDAQLAAIEDAFTISAPDSNTNSGTINWDYTISEADIDFLGEGETVTAVFTITVDDGNGGVAQQNVTITINVAVDAPVIEPVDVTGTVGDVAETADENPGDNAGDLQDDGSVTFSDVDLTDRPVATFEASSLTATGQNGSPLALTTDQAAVITNAFSIANADGNTNNGTVTWSYDLPESDVDFLGEGETVVSVYTITVTDDEGVSDTQDITITLTGANDAPVITVGDVEGAVSDIAETVDDNPPASAALLQDSGSITFADVDLTDRPTADFQVADVAAKDAGGVAFTLSGAQRIAIENAFSITADPQNSNVGTVDWLYQIEESAVDFLAEGESVTAVFTLTVTDDEGATDSQDVVVVITGANDAPVIAAGDESALVEDQASVLSDSGALGFADVDLSDQHSVSAARSATTWSGGPVLPAGLAAALDAAFATSIADASQGDGSGSIGWDFDLDNALVDFLAEGETLTVTYDVTVADSASSSQSDTEQVTVVITGTNDAPDIAAGDSGTLAEDSAAVLSDSGSLSFTDVDLNDSHSVSVERGTTTWSGGATLPDGVAAAIDTAFTAELSDPSQGDGSGSIDWNFDLDNVVADYLGASETQTITYDITVTDSATGEKSDTEQVTLTIVGANDAPTVSPVDVDGAVSEAPGTGDAAVPGGTLRSDSGSLTFADADLNDRPFASQAPKSVTGATAAGIALALTSGQVAAIEDAFSISALPGNTNTGTIAWDYAIADEAIDFLGAGDTVTAVFTVTLIDVEGASVAQDVTITITGANDAPVVSGPVSGTAVENDAAFTLDLLSGASDPDTTDTLAVANVVGVEGNAIGVAINGTNLAVDPSAYDYLGEGEQEIVRFSYDVVDASGAATQQTATITIDGQNDAPVLDLDADDSSDAPSSDYQTFLPDGAQAVAVADTDTAISDIDDSLLDGATLVLTNRPNGNDEGLAVAGTLPDGISAGDYDPATGILTLSGTASLADYRTALTQIEYTNSAEEPNVADRLVEITISDGTAQSNVATSTISFESDTSGGTDPVAVDDDGFSVNAGGTIDIPVADLLANDSDPNGEEFDLTSVFDVFDSTATIEDLDSGRVVRVTADDDLQPGAIFSFDYAIENESGGIGTATVEVMVDDIATPQVAV